jgi:hypothetical protein
MPPHFRVAASPYRQDAQVAPPAKNTHNSFCIQVSVLRSPGD